MEPVPTTRTGRRTVRVAVALVVGQALLCALIGYLTLGRSGASVDRMAEPPLVPPPATTGLPSPSASATTLSATATSRPARPGRDVATTRTKKAPEPAPATPAATAAPEPPPDPMIGLPTATATATATATPTPTPSTSATTSAPPQRGLLPPAPPSASVSPSVQVPVTVGDPCAPEWAVGRTTDGTLVRCVRTWHHGLRWKIV